MSARREHFIAAIRAAPDDDGVDEVAGGVEPGELGIEASEVLGVAGDEGIGRVLDGREEGGDLVALGLQRPAGVDQPPGDRALHDLRCPAGDGGEAGEDLEATHAGDQRLDGGVGPVGGQAGHRHLGACEVAQRRPPIRQPSRATVPAPNSTLTGLP